MNTSYDITATFVHTVEAEAEDAHRLLGQVDPMRSLADRLSALGLEDRAIWCRQGELAHTLMWRFGPDAGHARIDWQLQVDTDGAGRTTVALDVRARGSDPEARVRVLRAWLLVEELSRSHAERLARMVEDYAEEEPAAPVVRLPAVAVGMGF